MKKKILFSIIPITVILAAGLLLFNLSQRKMPFKKLRPQEVQTISLFAVPPNTTVEIEDRKQIEKIVEVLNRVVTYQEDDSGREYYGQLVQYTLKLADGKALEVGAYNPFIFINGKCYKTKYEPCEKLNSLGNAIIKGEFK